MNAFIFKHSIKEKLVKHENIRDRAKISETHQIIEYYPAAKLF